MYNGLKTYSAHCDSAASNSAPCDSVSCDFAYCDSAPSDSAPCDSASCSFVLCAAYKDQVRSVQTDSRPVQVSSDRFKTDSGQFRPVQDRFRPVQTRSDKSRPADRLNSVQEKRKIRFSGMGGKDEVIKMGETPLSAGAPSGKRRKKSDRRRRPYCAVQTCCGRGHGSFEK